MAKVSNTVEILPKITTACVGCTSVTDRQTDGRATVYSERERENVNVSSRSLKTNQRVFLFAGIASTSAGPRAKPASVTLVAVTLMLHVAPTFAQG